MLNFVERNLYQARAGSPLIGTPSHSQQRAHARAKSVQMLNKEKDCGIKHEIVVQHKRTREDYIFDSFTPLAVRRQSFTNCVSSLCSIVEVIGYTHV